MVTIRNMGQFRRIITVGAGGAPPAAETMGSTRVDWKSRNDITRVPPILRFLCPSPRRGSGSSRIHCKMKLPVRDLQLGGGIGGLSVSFAETPAMKMTQGRWRGLMGGRPSLYQQVQISVKSGWSVVPRYGDSRGSVGRGGIK